MPSVTPSRGFSLRERLLPSLLVAFALPLTLFLFAPLDLFAGNADEFSFGIWDFLPWCLLGTFLFAVLLCALLLPLRGRAFDVVWGLLLSVTLLLFLQGSYLNVGLSSLAGDGTQDATPTATVIGNAIIWGVVIVAVIVALTLAKKNLHEMLRLVGIIAMVTVLGMQTVSLTVTLLGSNIPSAPQAKMPDQSYLTYHEMNEVSDEGNVIVFVVDRFDRDYMETALTSTPELLSELDGFTYFDDATSLYPRTYPSVAYLATGVETDFSLSRKDYLNGAYEDAPFLHRLSQNGYRIHLYTDTYYAYENANVMSDYIANATTATPRVEKSLPLSFDMLRLSLYRNLPFLLKPCVGELSTPSFERHVTYEMTAEEKYSTDMRNTYEFLTEHPLEISANQKNFSFIHIAGTHLPNLYDRNFEEIGEDHPEYWSSASSMAQSFAIINAYLVQLKELGLYKDATIVITGDHASIGSDSAVPLRYSHLTTLLVKERGVATGEIVRSHAPVSHEDLFPTILASEGLDTDGFGRSVFDIPEDEIRERRYYFQKYQKESGATTYEQVEFQIVGEAKNYENWHIVSRHQLEKSIYD